MRTFGIIGRPLGHSLSKVYFEEKFAAMGLEGECRFLKFQLEDIGGLATVLNEYGEELKGFCVTLPYKKEVMSWLDETSDEALAMGAVNCVKVSGGAGGRRLSGFNTDAHGFRVGLEQLLGDARPRALVLGTGGASCAVKYVLECAGIEFKMVSRAGGGGDPGLLTYEELTPDVVAGHKLIVNTTPLGMSPNVETKPDLPYDVIGAGHYLYDLVYNPPVTAFLAEGVRRGAATIGGETMFRAQAEKNWEIWTS